MLLLSMQRCLLRMTKTSSGNLECSQLTILLRAVFYLNGKDFCLRGGEEHRQMKISQFWKEYEPLHYVYTEYASKHRAGSLAQLRVKNKVFPIDSVPAAGTRCHVNVLDQYFSKLPPEAFECDNFYYQPLSAISATSSSPWFSANSIGRSALAKMVKEICSEEKITGHKSNHSLRATGASELYHAGVPENIIKECTGHLSLTGLRHYECTADTQHKAVSKIL